MASVVTAFVILTIEVEAAMTLRWTAAAMLDAKKGLRRLKAHQQLAARRIVLKAHYEKDSSNRDLDQQAKAV